MPYTGPTKQDFETQILADLTTDDGESDDVLKERLELVRGAANDGEASRIYFKHAEESLHPQAEA